MLQVVYDEEDKCFVVEGNDWAVALDSTTYDEAVEEANLMFPYGFCVPPDEATDYDA